MWKEKLIQFGETCNHPAWGVAHFKRVYDLSLEIATQEGVVVNQDALFAAAYLHDMGAFPPYKRTDIDHAVSSEYHYSSYLHDIGFPKAEIPLVGEIIRGHMFYSKPGHSPESRVFHDADTLDFMGAIGIARMLSIVGIDDWTPDLQSAIALIEKFTKDLPHSLHYASSKAIGKERLFEMQLFLEALMKETENGEVV
jgi:uncharacterized protein